MTRHEAHSLMLDYHNATERCRNALGEVIRHELNSPDYQKAFVRYERLLRQAAVIKEQIIDAMCQGRDYDDE